METSVAVSIIRNEVARRAAYVTFDEILTKVLDAEEDVTKAKAEVKQYLQQVDEMKASLAKLDETLLAKETDLKNKLATVKASHEDALYSSINALQKDIDRATVELVGLEETIASRTAESEKLAVEINELEAEKHLAADELAIIKQQLAAIKAKL